MGAIQFKVGAPVLGFTSFAHVREKETATDAGVNLDAPQFARYPPLNQRSLHPDTDLLGLKPRVVHALCRGIEMVHHSGCNFRGHLRFPLSSFRNMPSIAARLALQKAFCFPIQRSTSPKGFGLNVRMYSRPVLRRVTNAARSRTLICLETVLNEIGNGAARSVTRASPRASRRKISRRVGSASAIRVWSRLRSRGAGITIFIHLDEY